ncbi:MAG: hypothetical protein AVDCRST_MAG47-3115, partial [uncultured Nocardioidaceae bacterium]
ARDRCRPARAGPRRRGLTRRRPGARGVRAGARPRRSAHADEPPRRSPRRARQVRTRLPDLPERTPQCGDVRAPGRPRLRRGQRGRRDARVGPGGQALRARPGL